MCVYKYLITGFIELYLKKANPYNIHISTEGTSNSRTPCADSKYPEILHSALQKDNLIFQTCIWAVDIFSQYVISLVMKHKKSYVKKQRREPLIANADEIIWN